MLKPISSISLFLLLIISSAKFAWGQTNSLSLELLGNGLFYSFNYERTFQEKERFTLAYRIGAAGLPLDEFTNAIYFIPIGVDLRLGKKPHQFVLGAGATISFYTLGNITLHAVPSISYRYQGIGKRIFFKLGYTPLIPSFFNTDYPYSWGGIMLGWDL